MKKITSLLLALVMALALAVPAFADELTKDEVSGDRTQNVTADVTVTKDQTVNKYFVEVKWKPISFSYTFEGAEYTWDTTGLKYEKKPIGKTGWGTNAAESQTQELTLTVSNKSDMAVYCKAVLTKDTNQPDTLNVSYGTNGVMIATANAVVDSSNPSNYTTNDGSIVPTIANLGGNITMSGTPKKATNSNTVLATITLTLSKTVLS